jgi:regulator of CtrA degradation
MSETATFPFIDRTYEDALELLTETRNYVAHQQSSSNDNGDIFEKFFVTTETSRLVSHLINVMTWLMWHKAANNGEISTDEAQQKGKEHLEKDLFANRQEVFDIDLPYVLEKLIGRSLLLHDRVSRLSRMVH